MPEALMSLEPDTPRTDATADSSGLSNSDPIDSNPMTNQSSRLLVEADDLTETGEDVTTDTLSKGRLKHELRMTRTNLATKAMIWENSEKLASAREMELQDEIRTLSRRLALANTRCDAAMSVASQAAQVEEQLTNAIEGKKQVTRELAQLQHELSSVRHFFTQLPVNHLIYTTEGPEKAFEVNVSSYSLLSTTEAEQLSTKCPTELCLLETVQLGMHRLVSLFSEVRTRFNFFSRNLNAYLSSN
ncbi:unnamed protein product [Echinostoma caproni]|uniref:Kinetochore protein SPC25 n=1 Tax=Echinostoma caproni TaxID=27848 RepID=A0A183B5W7_9TREM|nr:unnamed protein product [Echinostoma caproni]